MKTEIISVGTELLMGFVVDTNSSMIARELLGIGMGTYYHQTVGDNPKRMKEALQLASDRSDIIILTGGLGPTQDDITKQIVADFLDDELVEDKDQLEKILIEFSSRGEKPTEKAYREALTFKSGKTLFNEVGLACGCVFESKREGKMSQHFILLPGVPHEMEHMLKTKVLPYLQEQSQGDGVIDSLYLNLYGIGESKVAHTLDETILNQTNPTIAMYAKPQHVTIRLTANAAEKETARKMNQQIADEILGKLGPHFMGYGEKQTIESHVVELLKQKKLKLSMIEEFTGGMLMSSLTGISGVSQVLEGGLVTINGKSSGKQLGLTSTENEPEEEWARKLAEHCTEKFQTDIGLSISASMELDESGQLSSGTAFIALAVKGKDTRVKSIPLLTRSQEILRTSVKNKALAFLKEAVK